MVDNSTQELELVVSNLFPKFELATIPSFSKEAIIEQLSLRIAQLIAQNPEQLYSLLYRIDVAENDVHQVIANGEQISYHLALLIFDRQMGKIKSRAKYKKNTKPEDDLAW